MNFIKITLRAVLFFGILPGFVSCSGQNQRAQNTADATGGIGDTVSEMNGEIRCIFQDSDSNIWFASNGEGVFKFDGEKLIQLTQKHGLCSDFVWNILEGKDGKIWFKTRDAICYLDGYEFKSVREDTFSWEAKKYDYVKDEILVEYAYNGKSLGKIQLPQTSPLENAEDLRLQYDIYCTYKDRSGNLWFGTGTAGVCKFDGETYTWFDEPELGMPVRSIFEDKDGTIWIGNNGYGLFRYEGGILTNFTKEKNLENPDFLKGSTGREGTLARVWTIAEDSEGNLWIGTIDAGVWMFDGNTLTNYTTRDGLGSNSIWTLYKDKNDKLWFGTEGAGVYTFNGRTFEKFGL